MMFFGIALPWGAQGGFQMKNLLYMGLPMVEKKKNTVLRTKIRSYFLYTYEMRCGTEGDGMCPVDERVRRIALVVAAWE